MIRFVLWLGVLGWWLAACGPASPEAPPPTAGPLGVVILSPEDGAVVDQPVAEVRGLAPPNTVITLDAEIVLVGASGEFAASLPLAEGLNRIEIVASNAEGDQASWDLAVVYEPPQ